MQSFRHKLIPIMGVLVPGVLCACGGQDSTDLDEVVQTRDALSVCPSVGETWTAFADLGTVSTGSSSSVSFQICVQPFGSVQADLFDACDAAYPSDSRVDIVAGAASTGAFSIVGSQSWQNTKAFSNDCRYTTVRFQPTGNGDFRVTLRINSNEPLRGVTTRWYAFTGTGAPPPPSWCDFAHLRTGDYNGDGKLDLHCHLTDGRHLIAFSDGDGSFSVIGLSWPDYGAWCDPAHLRTGDYDGDGKLDLHCHLTDGRHLIAFSNGNGSFSVMGPSWPDYGAWCDPAHLLTGDFNGDGKLDLSCHSDAGGHIIAFSNGDGSFSSPGWLFNGWCDPAHLRTGDYNGDGKLDLHCHLTDGRHLIAFSDGDGSFSVIGPSWPDYGAWCDPAHLRTGDYNGDGKLDLHCHLTDGRHLIAFSNGNGSFSVMGPSWPDYGAWCDPAHLLTGDFNGDGKLDLSCHSDAGGHIIAFSNGDEGFSSPGWLFNDWCDPAHLRTGDYNGDGKLDISCHGSTGDVAGKHIVAFSSGSGSFAVVNGWWPY